MAGYEILGSIDMQGGVDVSSPILSPASQQSLSDGSWNAITSGSGYTRPWSGGTSQGAGTGSRKMLPFGSTWGGIKDIALANNTFLTTSIAANAVTTTTAHGWTTGTPCTVSTAGTLPTGLSALTTYYLIVVDSTHVKFAGSLALSLLGTALAIANAVNSTVTINVSTSSVTASGNFFQDIGLSRWGIGSGQPHIEGVNVPGYVLSTNLQVQVAVSGVFGAPVQAGLSQPSAPDIGIINTAGDISNSMSAKISRSRPSTGAISVASPTSTVIQPQANRIFLVFPLAQAGQTHWRVFFPFQGFGGTGVHYLGNYAGETDIPESVIASSTVMGGAAQATGTLTVGSLPLDGETILFSGTTFTFRSSPTVPTDVQIGGTTAVTALNLANVLNLQFGDTLTLTATGITNIVTVAYTTYGTIGNAFALANSSGGAVTRSGANLTGGVDGTLTRALEFNFQDGDLIPIEASFDDYAPPAATHAIRLNNVMNLPGCFADSTASPTTTNTGTAIAVSKENNYESYVPTSLLYLAEQVVDVLARPLDDYAYIACQNSISALQYVGDRGDDLPACTITTILPDIGIQYPHNWCHFRGQLVIYTAQGNLIWMDDKGGFDTSFAMPVARILKSLTPQNTQVGYDPTNDSLIVLNGKRMFVYARQTDQWRQIWLPDYSIAGTTLSCVTARRSSTTGGALYFTVVNGSVLTAYTYDTGTAQAPLSFVSNYQNSGGVAARDIYEMAIAAQTTLTTRLAVCISKNLAKMVWREIGTNGTTTISTPATEPFTTAITGKTFILFGLNVGGGGTVLLQGTITYVSATSATLSIAATGTLTDCLMFVGEWGSSQAMTVSPHLPNFFCNQVELRSYAVGIWLQSSGEVGNVNTVDLLGTTYASSRLV